MLYDVAEREENPYGQICPICSKPARGRCRCKRGDFSCGQGHHWFTCPVHGVMVGEAPHDIPTAADGCTCGQSSRRC